MKWIRANTYKQENEYQEYLAFFDYEIGAATLKISSETDYAAYINGEVVGYGQYEDLADYKVYDLLEITSFLKTGRNILCVRTFFENAETAHYTDKGLGLAFEVEIGGKVVAKSDENTLSRVSRAYKSGTDVPFITGQLGRAYYYDFTREDDWTNGGALDTFAPSQVICADVNVIERPIPKLVEKKNQSFVIRTGEFIFDETLATVAEKMYKAEIAEIQADITLPDSSGVKIKNDKNIYMLFDMRDEKTGILTFDIDADEPCYMAVGYGEHITDGRVRSYIGGRNFQFEFMLKKGRNKFVGHFRRLGMRYMSLFLKSNSAVVYDFNIISTDYPVNEKKTRIEDERLAEIYDTAIKTLKVCMHEHYEDTPWREQALYAMDSRNQMLCGYYAFDGYDFPQAALRLMSHNVRDDDMFTLTTPRIRKIDDINIPCFSLIQFCAMEDYIDFSGDTAIIRDYEATYRRVLDKFISLKDQNHLLGIFNGDSYWNFYEWNDLLDDGDYFGAKRPRNLPQRYDAPLNAFFVMATRSMINMLKKINRYNGEYDQTLKTSQEALEKFFDCDKRCYADFMDKDGKKWHYSELTNSLCACVTNDAEHKTAATESLINGRLPIKITLSYSIFKYDALMNYGKKYEEFILRDIKRIWGKMLDAGASTFYEDELGDAAFGNAGSLSHGWSAVPVYVFHKLGICK